MRRAATTSAARRSCPGMTPRRKRYGMLNGRKNAATATAAGIAGAPLIESTGADVPPAHNVLLIILDGFGLGENPRVDAIARAKKPFIDSLLKSYPWTAINASNEDVGLPAGQMGNSEVGHMNIGAGRVVYQEITRINRSIRTGEFFEKPAFIGAVERVKRRDSALHLIGLLSDGGVHSL